MKVFPGDEIKEAFWAANDNKGDGTVRDPTSRMTRMMKPKMNLNRRMMAKIGRTARMAGKPSRLFPLRSSGLFRGGGSWFSRHVAFSRLVFGKTGCSFLP